MSTNKITITINNIKTTVSDGITILEACRSIGVEIPTLCYLMPSSHSKLHTPHSTLKATMPDGSCRMCVVEVSGGYKNGIVASCIEICKDGMTVDTHSEKVRESRRFILDLLLSDHTTDCFACAKNGECQLQRYAIEYEIDKTSYEGERSNQGQKYTGNPFFEVDPERCVLCARCVRICAERQGCNALGIMNRGFSTKIGTGTNPPPEQCESCGNCVTNCPTGALTPKYENRFRVWETHKVRTTCPYCGVGCQMDLLVKDEKVVDVRSAIGKVNEGMLCAKGKFAFDFINHPARLTEPLARNKEGKLERVTWDEALEIICKKINEIKGKFGPDAITGFTGAKATNEENYLFMKLMRAAIGTNNVDHCARLCHSSSVAGLAATLGSAAMTNPIADVRNAGAIFITGSNTTKTHPVMGAFVRQAKNAGAKLIVADPVRIPLAEIADVYLQIKPGTSVALSNGMLNVIFAEGLEDKEYIKKHTTGVEELKKLVEKYTPEYTSRICDVPPEDIIKAARLYANAVYDSAACTNVICNTGAKSTKTKSASILYAMGITQHVNGTDNVISLSNLALCTGNLGRPGSGVNPLRGQNNVQGACDMGALPPFYTAYQQVANPEARAKFEDAWQVQLPDKPGLTKTLAIPAILEDKVKMMYIMGENPAVSDPDSNRTIKALKKAFLVVQDIFLTETAELADVVLPAACFAEKDGTFVNSERRVQLVRKAVPTKGDSLADWEIIMKLTNRLGYKCSFNSPEDIFDEMAALTPSYAGMTYAGLEENGLCWPCPTKDHPGTPMLHVNGPVKGKAELRAVKWKPSPETQMPEYPILLTTNRLLHQFHTRTMTAKSKAINIQSPDNFIQINLEDAKLLEISDGDTVKVTSKRGSILVTAVLTNEVAKGTAAMPFHWSGGANVLTSAEPLDPTSKIAGLKLTGVRIEKINRCEN